MHLKRELTLFDLVFYGLGIIIGAGIYVLVGHAAGIAGNGVWMSFLLAAVIALLTGLSYAELSSLVPRDAAEYNYVKTAFREGTFAFVVGWLVFFAAVISSAVVSLGFGNYFHKFTGISPQIAATGLVLLFAFISYHGLRDSSKVNMILTSITLIGLLIVIVIGAPYVGSVNYFEIENGFAGAIGAATLVFFAYLGFEQIANMSEEAKNARKNMPKAIIISIILASFIYVMVAISAVSVVPWQELGESGTPLALVAERGLGGQAETVLSLFGLFATAGTVLVFIVAGSRMLFGLAEGHALSKILLRVDKKRGTPYVAIGIIAVISVLFIFMGGIKEIALIVDFSAFLIFALINLCAFTMRFSHPDATRSFRIPVSVGRASVFPLAGFLISAFMLLQFDMRTAWIVAIIMIAGYLFYKYEEAARIGARS